MLKLLTRPPNRSFISSLYGSVSTSGDREIAAVSISRPLPQLCIRWCSTFSDQFPMAAEKYTFGPYKIDRREVFLSSQLSYAMVNLRPLLPGHVLVCPRREVKRFTELTAEETSDLWLTAQKVGKELESFHSSSSITFAIQDGPQAGQTVPHVHIHIIPRKSGDFEKNDEIYEALDVKEKELNQRLDLDKERKDRTLDEMAEEAEQYRKLFS